MVVAVSILATVSCARDTRGATIHTVSITNFAFAPAELTVERGDTVVWRNTDFVPHTATARDSTWDSSSLPANSTWRFVAGASGRHEYYCVLHPTMRGTIVVR